MVPYDAFPLSRFAKNLCAVALGLLIAGTTTLASADPGDGERSGTYLSLGDSAPYGYITHDGPAYLNPRKLRHGVGAKLLQHVGDFRDPRGVYVNLYLPSSVRWIENGGGFLSTQGRF